MDNFIEGGLRPRPILVDLPHIEDVERGSIYHDAATGTLWKAIHGGTPTGRWVHAETVTATEHAGVKRQRRTCLLVLIAAMLLVGLMTSGAFAPLPNPWSFLVPFALGGVILILASTWLRYGRQLEAHLVAPSSTD